MSEENEFDELEESFANQLKADIKSLDTTRVGYSNIRQKIITKLTDVVDHMVIDPDKENNKVIDSKMNVINTLLNTMKCDEDQITNVISVKQKQERTEGMKETLSSVSQIVAEYIKTINSGDKNILAVSDDKCTDCTGELDKLADTIDDILDDELVI